MSKLKFHMLAAMLLMAIATLSIGDQSIAQESSSFLPRSTPEAQGIDSSVLEDIVARVEGGEFGELDSLIVIRNDHIVFEEYFNAHGPELTHALFSVSKSTTSTIFGVAVDKGFITSLDQKLLDFFPEYNESTIGNWDERKADITLEDVLSMRTGLEWDEWSSPYGTPQNDTWGLVASFDWIKHVLDKRMVSDPGTSFTYNSGLAPLLAAVIRSATGQSMRDFAAEHIYGPMGIEDAWWELALPGGLENGGFGGHMRTIDMAKVGQLFLHDGMWQGTRLLSSSWIRTSTSPYVHNAAGSFEFGLHWWLETRNASTLPAGQINVLSARGHGGQFIFVVEDLNMVIAMNASNYRNGRSGSQSTVLFPEILEAVTTP